MIRFNLPRLKTVLNLIDIWCGSNFWATNLSVAVYFKWTFWGYFRWQHPSSKRQNTYALDLSVVNWHQRMHSLISNKVITFIFLFRWFQVEIFSKYATYRIKQQYMIAIVWVDRYAMIGIIFPRLKFSNYSSKILF